MILISFYNALTRCSMSFSFSANKYLVLGPFHCILNPELKDLSDVIDDLDQCHLAWEWTEIGQFGLLCTIKSMF